MKKALSGLILILLLLALFACVGKKGEDGKIYLRIQLVNCTSYWDNNDAIPFGFSSQVYYLCGPGSYSYEYDTADGWNWWGTYTLVAEEGEEGQLFQNGADGQDRRYTFTCQSSGPSLTYFLDKSTQGKQIQSVQTGENEFELIHSDGVYRFHIKATRRALGQVNHRNKAQ